MLININDDIVLTINLFFFSLKNVILDYFMSISLFKKELRS